jgi:predicted P-loop ATPase
MNGMIVDARLEGIACWNSMVPTLVLSDKEEDYHPFHLYLEELPEWDGTDRATPLLQRVSDDALWLKGGRYWLRALTAQWMGMEREHANTLVPVLVSSEQGLGKSTFCRSLLPDSLRAYYLDNLNLSPSASPEKKLVKAGLINLDEFDKISEKRQPDLKNLLQMMSVPIYRGKRLGYVTEPRLASFIATTNSRQILSDPTGSRRFLCVEVTDMISEAPIEHKQLYAQLKQEVLNGERDYLNKEEEKEVQRRNKAYYRQSPLEDVFHAYFRHPKADEEGEWLTAAEMFRILSKRNASALRGISAKQLSFRLTAMGFKPRHTDHGNYYQVVRRYAA